MFTETACSIEAKVEISRSWLSGSIYMKLTGLNSSSFYIPAVLGDYNAVQNILDRQDVLRALNDAIVQLRITAFLRNPGFFRILDGLFSLRVNFPCAFLFIAFLPFLSPAPARPFSASRPVPRRPERLSSSALLPALP